MEKECLSRKELFWLIEINEIKLKKIENNIKECKCVTKMYYLEEILKSKIKRRNLLKKQLMDDFKIKKFKEIVGIYLDMKKRLSIIEEVKDFYKTEGYDFESKEEKILKDKIKYLEESNFMFEI